MKITLRKLATVGSSLQTVIKNEINAAQDTSKVTLRATKDHVAAIVKAEKIREETFAKISSLQEISSNLRRTVANANVAFGVNEILQKLREDQDRLEVLKAFYVHPSRKSSRYLYTDLEEAQDELRLYEDSLARDAERLRGSSEVNFALPPVDAIQTEVKELERKIKFTKEETLLRANLNEVDFLLTTEQKALLEEYNLV